MGAKQSSLADPGDNDILGNDMENPVDLGTQCVPSPPVGTHVPGTHDEAHAGHMLTGNYIAVKTIYQENTNSHKQNFLIKDRTTRFIQTHGRPNTNAMVNNSKYKYTIQKTNRTGQYNQYNQQ
jgi:hypothetical protein